MNRSSVLWSAVRNWGPRLGTILTFFVLARILDKPEIGMFAAAAALISFTELFADNGFSDAIVRTRTVSPGVATSILIINVAIAAAIYVLITTFSSQIGTLMGVSGIGPILQVVGLSLVLNSLGYVPQALLRKRFEFKRLAFRSLASTVVGAAVGLSMAFANYGVWSMVGQLLVTTLINVVFLWVPLVLRPTTPKANGLGEIMPFALRVFGSRTLTYLSLRVVELAIPLYFGPTALATYLMGSRVPAVLAQMLTGVMVDVNLPHFSRLADRPDELRETYYSSLRSFSAISIPAFLGIAAVAPEISMVAFGANGVGTDYVMSLIAILGALQSVGYSNEVFLNAFGLPKINLRVQILAAVVIMICLSLFFVGLNDNSVDHLISAYVACHCIVILFGLAYGANQSKTSLLRIFSAFGPFAIAGTLALVGVRVVYASAGANMNFPFIESLLFGLLFVTIYICTLAVIDRRALSATLSHLRTGRTHT